MIGRISAIAGGANGNRHCGSGFRRSQHVTPAVEDATRLDHHARRVYLSSHNTFGLDLHATLRENHAVEAAGNHNAIALDLTFHLGAITKDHGLLRNDGAFHIAIDTERAGDGQSAFECYALIDESCPSFTPTPLSIPCPLPSHLKPPIHY